MPLHVNCTSIYQPTRLERRFHARKRMAQAMMLFRLGARTNFPLHGDTQKLEEQFYVMFRTHPHNSEESIIAVA